MRPGAVPIAAACLAACAACSFDTAGIGSGSDGGGGTRVDAEPQRDADPPPGDADVPADADLPAVCGDDEVALPFDAANVGRCVPAPQEALVVPAKREWRIDTDRMVLEKADVGTDPPEITSFVAIAQPGGPELLVVVLESLRIEGGAALEIVGDRPLALVSLNSIDVEGILTAAAERTVPGPGAGGTGCDAGGGVQQQFGGEAGGSGGGGGGFGAAGGEGAKVNLAVGPPPPQATAGGSVVGNAELVPLRGGCPGGNGFQVDLQEDDPEDAGGGGGGGGGLQLVAANRVRVEGTVTAGGGGGQPGIARSGGGGGGSGGALLLQASTVEIQGALTANGGGGGEGMRRIRKSGPCSNPTPGGDGAPDSDQPAAGGSHSCPTSGSGGDGGARDVEAGQNGQEGDSASTSGAGAAPAGGGGGGGGVGRIRIDTCEAMSGGGEPVFSPEPVVGETLACDD